MKKIAIIGLSITLVSTTFISCKKDNTTKPVTATGKNINTATKVSIDRFATGVGHLQLRTATNGLPAANAPVNFDNQPFITTGLTPAGASVSYYNFDIQSTTPSPIYVMFKNGSSTPVTGQNNVVATIPGDATYNDFWLVNKVTVPDNYVANSLTSQAAILASGYTITPTNTIVNCPIVPFGSTANRSFTANTASTLTLGWYKDQAVAYFNFGEAPLTTTTAGLVPTAPIYVMFKNNMSPANGFKTDSTGVQTHNVISVYPGDSGYSPLWSVSVIDTSHFSAVTNLSTAQSFTSSMPAGANVNCPVIK
jgi:hypothetical protein